MLRRFSRALRRSAVRAGRDFRPGRAGLAKAAGMRLDLDLVSRSVIGLVEVLKGLRFFRQAFHLLNSLAEGAQAGPPAPHRLSWLQPQAGRAGQAPHGRALVYYISPQVWAWKKGRVPLMARLLRKMLVTFPFEKPIYDKAGLDCAFVGNPLVDAIPAAKHRSRQRFAGARPTLSSRGQKPGPGPALSACCRAAASRKCAGCCR